MRELVKQGSVFCLIFMLVLVNITLLSSTASANGSTIYVDDDNTGTEDGTQANPYNTVQEGVDAASLGDTVYVKSGLYYENVIIDKTIDLIGEDRDTTIINGSEVDNVIEVTADYVNISGLTLEDSGSSSSKSGIYIFYADYCTIEDCLTQDNKNGISLPYSSFCIVRNNVCRNNEYMGIKVNYGSNNTVNQNDCKNNQRGISLYGSKDSIIQNNSCTNNEYGLSVQESENCRISNQTIILNSFVGIAIYSSLNVRAENNNCQQNEDGIRLNNINEITISNNNFFMNENGFHIQNSENSIICNNTIFGSTEAAIKFSSASDNTFFHNNFLRNENTIKVLGSPVTNLWYHPGLEEGNFWLDYRGSDNGSGTGKHAIANDGIGDTDIPYPEAGYDEFPLMDPTYTGLVHNVNKNIWYSTIQDAVDDVESYDLLKVYEGVYKESISITGSLDIVGANRERIIIDGEENDDVVSIQSDEVMLSNLTIKNSDKSPPKAGIMLRWSEDCIVENCVLSDNGIGIQITQYSDDNLIVNNTCSNNNNDGIFMQLSSNNNLFNNTCTDNQGNGIMVGSSSNGNTISKSLCSNNKFSGIYLFNNAEFNNVNNNTCILNGYHGISVYLSSDNNDVCHNKVDSNTRSGLIISNSNENNIYENQIYSNTQTGIKLISSNNNVIFHNNIIDNMEQANDNGNNIWSLSYSEGGNYWSDWIAPDNNFDGYTDNPYSINGGSLEDDWPFASKLGWILVGRWRMDENFGIIASDTSGNKNNGSLMPGASIYAPEWVDGKSGSGLKLDGSQDYISVPNSDTLDITKEITIMAWVKPNITQRKYIVHKGWEAGKTGIGGVYSLDLYPGSIRTVLTDTSSRAHILTGRTKVLSKVWQHIAVTWNGSQMSLFYNSKLDAEKPFTGTLSTGTGEVLLGRYGSLYFDGVLDEVQIYDRALSAEFISEHYLEYQPYLVDPLLVPTKIDGEVEYRFNDTYWYRADTTITPVNMENSYPELYESTENITWMINNMGISSDLTYDENEIWYRTGKVWEWFAKYRTISSHENYSEIIDFYDSWKEENNAFISINAIAYMIKEWKGFKWAACMSKANAFSAALYTVGIPEDKCGVIGFVVTPMAMHHFVPAVNVFDRWFYMDAQEWTTPFQNEEPASIPLNHPYDWRHPYWFHSANNKVPNVPLCYFSINEPIPNVYLPLGIEAERSVYPGEGVTVHFSEITVEGDTSVEFTSGSPEPNFELVPTGIVYEIGTNSEFDGPVIISIQYDESQVPGNEEDLELKHWDESLNEWIDITTWVDTENNTIYGETYSFSKFAIMIRRTARELKIEVKNDLLDSKSSYKFVDWQIDWIINRIDESLNNKYWQNETHIDPKHGDKVFVYELTAVAKMQKLIKCYPSYINTLNKKIANYESRGWNASCLRWKVDVLERTIEVFNISIHKLIRADDYLARTVLYEAENMTAKCTKYQSRFEFWLNKSKISLIKANEAFSSGNFCKTIIQYKLVWKYAQRALDWANK